jgi:hypothetical protein
MPLVKHTPMMLEISRGDITNRVGVGHVWGDAMRSDTFTIALHESGHALMAYFVGGSAWIERKATGGQCGARVPEWGDDERWIVSHLLIDAAGLAAESLLAPYDAQALAAAQDDRRDFFAGVRTLKSLGSRLTFGEDASWRLYVATAKKLLRPHLHVLGDLAQQADRWGRLDRDTVERRILWWKLTPLLGDEGWKDVLLENMDQALDALEDGR